MSQLDCRDKVRDEINNVFALSAESVLIPVTDFQTVKTIKVFVAVSETISSLVDRQTTRKIYTIQVGIIQKVISNGVDPETVLDLVRNIENHFNNKNLPVAAATPTYHAAGQKIIYYDYDQLDKDNIVQSILELDYKEFVI